MSKKSFIRLLARASRTMASVFSAMDVSGQEPLADVSPKPSRSMSLVGRMASPTLPAICTT